MIDYVKAGVLDTDFYLMQYIRGRIFTDANLDAVPLESRREIHEEVIRVLAQIQSVNLKEANLEDYGRPGIQSHNNLFISNLIYVNFLMFRQLLAKKPGKMA
jgi:aminoglycoside phosphotransferase (APT) family kinase protein